MVNIKINCPLFGKHRHQLLAAVCANLIGIAHGAGIGWLSPTLLILLSSDSPLDTGPISVSESSWLGSLLCAGGIIGSLSFGLIATNLGRKKALCLLAFPQIGFWLIVIFIKNINYLYIGRVLAGITGGGCFVTVPLFVSDIARKEIRGSLGSFVMLGVNTGILIGYVIGSYLDYSTVPRVLIILPILFFFSVLFLPETPQFLLSKNKEEDARKSLCFYYNFKVDSDVKADQQELDLQILEMKSVVGNSPSEKVTIKDFVSPAGRKGILIGLGLVAVNILSGIFVIVNYTAIILQESGTEIAPNEAAIIISVSQIGGTYASTLIVDHLKRKTLLITTTICAMIGFTIMGTSIYLVIFHGFTNISWMPVASLSFTIFVASSGYIPLTFVVMSEVIPRNIRPVASSICNCILNLLAFTMLKALPLLVESWGLHIMMWTCACACFLGALFNVFCVPETKTRVI